MIGVVKQNRPEFVGGHYAEIPPRINVDPWRGRVGPCPYKWGGETLMMCFRRGPTPAAFMAVDKRNIIVAPLATPVKDRQSRRLQHSRTLPIPLCPTGHTAEYFVATRAGTTNETS
jgi:hypothetical protein